jgi:MFS family permease
MAVSSIPASAQITPIQRLWKRDLNAYPKGPLRVGLLLLVVAAGICLTSLGLVAGTVSPLLKASTGISTSFYSYLLVAAAVVGAIASYFSSITDTIGRANLIVYGALVAGLIAFFGVPSAHSKWEFAIWYCIMGFADGISLVGGAGLMRDFTPQTGRATAMGINTLGTGASALLLSFIGGRVLSNNPEDWRKMFHIAGAACLVVFVIVLFLLRELPAHLRGQVRVRLSDEEVIEETTSAADDRSAIAATETGWAKWRQVLTPRVIAAGASIMFYLVIYATAAGYLTLYNVYVQGLSLSRANDLGTWYWGVNCVALILAGIISDRLQVRKPVMMIGGVFACISIIFVMTAHHASFTYLCVFMCLWSAGQAGGFSAWYAAYSEDAERINPLFVGAVFAVGGAFSRFASVITGLLFPHIVKNPADNSQWQHWFIICFICMALVIPLAAYGLGGFYNPRKAREDTARRSEEVQRLARERAAAGITHAPVGSAAIH